MNRKALSLLSLCQRSGNLSTGESVVEQQIQKKKAFLVIIAQDASDNTKKKFINKCRFYDIPIIITSSKEELSSAVGKFNRSSFAICHESFALSIQKELGLME
ncbi:MAG: L7Ae/L30e/S12e/Gadd45 family ribosomal protein [Lachnospirales bacterium]